jgi:hypothetical protein
MANSAALAVDAMILAAQYNNLRLDTLDVATGHAHTGAADGGKFIGNVPIGGILIWSGTVVSIPAHYSICDGTSGTPDLRNRFVIGAKASGSYTVGASGGATTKDVSHTHSSTGITVGAGGSHTHGAGSLASNSTGSHVHTIVTGADAGNNAYIGAGYVLSIVAGAGNHSHSFSGSTAAEAAHVHTISGTSASGGSATQDIMPPYFALCFIQRIT